jgi:hypothetical protein
LQKETGRLRYDITCALQKITGKDFPVDGALWKGWFEAKKNNPVSEASRHTETELMFFDIPIYSNRLMFILDYSGSMDTEVKGSNTNLSRSTLSKNRSVKKIDLALAELERVLKNLPREAYFNIIIMNTEAKNLKKRKFARQVVSASFAQRALDFAKDAWDKLGDLRRGRGDLYDALMEAFEDREVDTVIVISDGKPTYGEYIESLNILEQVGRQNSIRKVMIHTVLTGNSGVDAKFMKSLAEQTGGMFVRK